MMRCDNCGSPDARLLRVTRTFDSGPDMLVIENVPLVSCPKCGESYLTAETLHAIDGIRARSDRESVKRQVAVVTFD
ncbi:MAG TPA: YgiT-type zinc finger protein [Longimicrobiales bacterium]|nr:YgiT-type zinc finger protein [Longimicrobiales bacterium]